MEDETTPAAGTIHSLSHWERAGERVRIGTNFSGKETVASAPR